MSEKLKDECITIYEALYHINNKKYIMPAFQRQFVWTMEKIEKLWDSILLDYPIATFLFWHIDDSNVTKETKFCEFLNDVTFNSRKVSDSTNYELTHIDLNITDIAILDGQQRLTSLFISLFGDAFIRPTNARRINGEKLRTKLLIELNKNKLDIDEDEYNSKRYGIFFTDKVGRLSPTQFEIKNILKEEFQNKSTIEKAIEDTIVNVPNDSKDYARNILKKLYNKIFTEKLIRYTKIIDMKQDDALEMFVRFNSGGKPLSKSDITMSILEVYWPSARTEFGKLLTGAFHGFGTDFIVRTALMLYGDVIKSNIDKKMVENLKNDWGNFKKSLTNLEELLKSFNIDINKFSSSWNILLPIIFYIYYSPEYSKNLKSIKAYLLRASFFTYFQSGTTSKLQQMKNHIIENNEEITIDMLDQISDLMITDGKIDDVLNSEKGSRIAGEVLYYLSLDWRNKTIKYEQDHLHPDNRFNKGLPHSVTADEWKTWRANRNRLPNLHLLEGISNGSKSDMPLIDFFNDMNEEQQEIFYKTAIIPKDVSLEIQNFGQFYEERRKLLKKKILELLS